MFQNTTDYKVFKFIYVNRWNVQSNNTFLAKFLYTCIISLSLKIDYSLILFLSVVERILVKFNFNLIFSGCFNFVLVLHSFSFKGSNFRKLLNKTSGFLIKVVVTTRLHSTVWWNLENLSVVYKTEFPDVWESAYFLHSAFRNNFEARIIRKFS